MCLLLLPLLQPADPKQETRIKDKKKFKKIKILVYKLMCLMNISTKLK